MLSIAQCLKRAEEIKQSGSSRLDVECLLTAVLKKPRSYLYTWPDKTLTGDQYARFEILLARRSQGEPIAHLTGEKEFWGSPFLVNSSTLIPRPETELLVELALAKINEGRANIADLGTGTGAIACALAKERPQWNVLALDAVEEAVSLAEKNRDQLKLTNVRVQQSNWFEGIAEERFDGIVSNPPYIAEGDSHLREGDLRFEPSTALVSGPEGLDAIRHIIGNASKYLSAGGWLLLEHGYDQGGKVRNLFTEQGFMAVETAKDLAGQDRVTYAQAPRASD